MGKKKLLVIGAGGHGKVVVDIALKMKRWGEIAFLDDNEKINYVMGIEIIGTIKDVNRYIEKYDVFVAIGNNKIREKIQKELENDGATIQKVIHPSAIIGVGVEIGAGTAIMAGVVINCCSVIGKGCILNTCASIDHDNTIGNYVHLSPGVTISGTSNVGKGTWVGSGSVISNNIMITDDCRIGAGTVIIKDINEKGTYVGVPARRVGNGKVANISE